MERKLLENRSVCHYKSPISYTQFFGSHLVTLEPCLINGLADAWPAMSLWRKDDLTPNTKFLAQRYGTCLVTVSNDGREPEQMLFSDFLQALELSKDCRLYAKDMHLARLSPSAPFYECPELFRDDYLNFYLEGVGDLDDYKFVYFGADKTKTALHRDVVASHSWSTNICGTKRWTLLPPEFVPYITSRHHEYPQDLFDTKICRNSWPNIEKAQKSALVIIQGPGETMFVPSSWFHQVENFGSTLSINHNWINYACLEPIFANLHKETLLTQVAIRDLRDDGILDKRRFAEVCQEILSKNVGMDYKLFFDILLYRFEHEKAYIDIRLRPQMQVEIERITDIVNQFQCFEEAAQLSEVSRVIQKLLQVLAEFGSLQSC